LNKSVVIKLYSINTSIILVFIIYVKQIRMLYVLDFLLILTQLSLTFRQLVYNFDINGKQINLSVVIALY